METEQHFVRVTFIILNQKKDYVNIDSLQTFVKKIREKVPAHSIILWDDGLNYLYGNTDISSIKQKEMYSADRLTNFLRSARLESDKVVLIAPPSIAGSSKFPKGDFAICTSLDELETYIDENPEIAIKPQNFKVKQLPSPSPHDRVYFQNDSFARENFQAEIIGILEQFIDVTYQYGRIDLRSFSGDVRPVDDIRNFSESVGEFNPDVLINDVCETIKDGANAFVIFADDNIAKQFCESIKSKDEADIDKAAFLNSLYVLTCDCFVSFQEHYHLIWDVIYPKKVQSIKDPIKLKIVVAPSSQNASCIINKKSFAELSFAGARAQTHLSGRVCLSDTAKVKTRCRAHGGGKVLKLSDTGILDRGQELVIYFVLEPRKVAGIYSFPRKIRFSISKNDHIYFSDSCGVNSNYICGSLLNQFPYTVLVWGAPGAGKTSLVNTMANAIPLVYRKDKKRVDDNVEPTMYMRTGDREQHVTTKIAKKTISEIVCENNENVVVADTLNTFFIDIPGADPEIDRELFENYCIAALDGKIPRGVDIVEDGKLKNIKYGESDPLLMPQAVILVIKRGQEQIQQEDGEQSPLNEFIQMCQRRDIHPILVWTNSTEAYGRQDEPDFGIHKEHIFRINSYTNADKCRNPETDMASLDILEAVHSEAALHHYRITKETNKNAKFIFKVDDDDEEEEEEEEVVVVDDEEEDDDVDEDWKSSIKDEFHKNSAKEKYVMQCGFPKNTMLKIFFLGREEPLCLRKHTETEIPLTSLDFEETSTEDAIQKFKRMIKEQGGDDLTDYDFVLRSPETKPSAKNAKKSQDDNLLRYLTHAGGDVRKSTDKVSSTYYAYLFVKKNDFSRE